MLEDSECEIVLRHEDVVRRSQEILDRYRVPSDRSPDLMACPTRLHGESGAERRMSDFGSTSGSWTA